MRIPIAPTRGYMNLGDVAIYFSAFTFGPFTALIAGGLGTALADLLAGYPQWIPISLLRARAAGPARRAAGRGSADGSEQASAAGRRHAGAWRRVRAAAGTLVMCGGYFAAGA